MQDEPKHVSGEQRVIIEDYPESVKEQPVRDKTKDELNLANNNQQSVNLTRQQADKATQFAIQGIILEIFAGALLQVLTGILGIAMWYSPLRWFPFLIPAALLMLSFFSIFRSTTLQNQSANPNRVFILNCIGLVIAVALCFYFIINIPFFINPTDHILDRI